MDSPCDVEFWVCDLTSNSFKLQVHLIPNNFQSLFRKTKKRVWIILCKVPFTSRSVNDRNVAHCSSCWLNHFPTWSIFFSFGGSVKKILYRSFPLAINCFKKSTLTYKSVRRNLRREDILFKFFYAGNQVLNFLICKFDWFKLNF